MFTIYFVQKIPQRKLTQSSVKINVKKSSRKNENSYLSHQKEHEHVHRDSQINLLYIQLYLGQSQKLSNKEKIEYFQTWAPESQL